jgi:anti-sigma regulatory factor (Ser/Thr protein kinase)
MLQALLSVIRLLIDPQLRATVASVRQSASNTGEGWAKQIRRVRAKFRGDEEYLASVFASTLREELVGLGVSERAITSFATVFDELVRNAFSHGCDRRRRGKVRVICDYSRWFIRLRVADSGRGFRFLVYRSAPQYEKHGLGIISKETLRFEANKRGNALTALIGSHDDIRVEVTPLPEDAILYVRVSNQDIWHYSNENWAPLLELLGASDKRLILIECTSQTMRWDSARVRTTKDVLASITALADRRVAFLVDWRSLDLFDFSHLDSKDSRVFLHRQYEQARDWLLDG